MRYVVIEDGWPVDCTNDIVKYAESRPCAYGLEYYDTEQCFWVFPGKRSARIKTGWTTSFSDVVERVKTAGGLISVREMEESFAASDDTFTEFDRKQHERAVRAARILDLRT